MKDDDLNSAAELSPASRQKLDRHKSHVHALPPPPPSMVKKHGSNDDKFVYNGQVDLVDLEVVVGSALEDERRFEVSILEGSFVVYARFGKGNTESPRSRGERVSRPIMVVWVTPSRVVCDMDKGTIREFGNASAHKVVEVE